MPEPVRMADSDSSQPSPAEDVAGGIADLSSEHIAEGLGNLSRFSLL